MSENNVSIDEIEKVFTEVCELTSDKCEGALNDFKNHKNKLKLVVDVFKAIDKCNTEKCNINKDEIYSKLNTFLRSKE